MNVTHPTFNSNYPQRVPLGDQDGSGDGESSRGSAMPSGRLLTMTIEGIGSKALARIGSARRIATWVAVGAKDRIEAARRFREQGSRLHADEDWMSMERIDRMEDRTTRRVARSMEGSNGEFDVNEEGDRRLTKEKVNEGVRTRKVNRGSMLTERMLRRKKSGWSLELAVKKRDLHERDCPRRRRRPRL